MTKIKNTGWMFCFFLLLSLGLCVPEQQNPIGIWTYWWKSHHTEFFQCKRKRIYFNGKKFVHIHAHAYHPDFNVRNYVYIVMTFSFISPFPIRLQTGAEDFFFSSLNLKRQQSKNINLLKSKYLKLGIDTSSDH